MDWIGTWMFFFAVTVKASDSSKILLKLDSSTITDYISALSCRGFKTSTRQRSRDLRKNPELLRAARG